jgi:hypothetical protein
MSRKRGMHGKSGMRAIMSGLYEPINMQARLALGWPRLTKEGIDHLNRQNRTELENFRERISQTAFKTKPSTVWNNEMENKVLDMITRGATVPRVMQEVAPKGFLAQARAAYRNANRTCRKHLKNLMGDQDAKWPLTNTNPSNTGAAWNDEMKNKVLDYIARRAPVPKEIRDAAPKGYLRPLQLARYEFFKHHCWFWQP